MSPLSKLLARSFQKKGIKVLGHDRLAPKAADYISGVILYEETLMQRDDDGAAASAAAPALMRL